MQVFVCISYIYINNNILHGTDNEGDIAVLSTTVSASE